MAESNRRPRERSQRQLRVGELVRHTLSAVLERGEFRDPTLAGATVTVTEVRISPDMRNATVFVMPLGGEGGVEIVTALRRAGPYLRRRVGEEMALKRLPALSFELDRSFDNAQRIDELLRSAEPPRGEETETGDDAETGGGGDGA